MEETCVIEIYYQFKDFYENLKFFKKLTVFIVKFVK